MAQDDGFSGPLNGLNSVDSSTFADKDYVFPTAEWAVPNRTKDQKPDPNTFELGLVMAGAVSAGAYTAGVIDFLIEALDTWEAAKAAGKPNVPGHSVRIPVISGTSAGGMTTAILAAHAHRAFPPVREAQTRDGKATGNPLFDAWVNQIDARALLTRGNLGAKPPVSVLNGQVLDDIVTGVLDGAARTTKKQRPVFGDGVRAILTATNLQGTPYWQRMRGQGPEGFGMDNGRDYRCFVVAPPGSDPHLWSDETLLRAEAVTAHDGPWHDLGQWALSTGAFPIALPARELSHRPDDRDYRVVGPNPDPDLNEHAGRYLAMSPSAKPPGQVPNRFIAIDGGLLNNEPLGLAHRVLAGAEGHNPRAGADAFRATVLIDPFPSGPAQKEPGDDARALWAIAPGMINAWKSSARFYPQDLLLASHDEVYSRFLIAPMLAPESPGAPRKGPLACGVMGGFGGFLHREFRRHDFLLGRRNCQKMLTEYLVLPADNLVFKRGSTPNEVEAALEPYRVTFEGDDRNFYPIIPVLRDTPVADPEPRPKWPDSDLVNVDDLSRRFADRADEVLDHALATGPKTGFAVRIALDAFRAVYLKPKIRKAARDYLNKALTCWHLHGTDRDRDRLKCDKE